MPGRKAGGVSGLLRGRDSVETPMSMSRSESQESVSAADETRIRKIMENSVKGKGKDGLLSAPLSNTGAARWTEMGVS